MIKTVKEKSPRTKIYLWTGYLYEELKEQDNRHIQYILQNINTLIDGPFIQEERDITLKMRGSRNQRIIDIQ